MPSLRTLKKWARIRDANRCQICADGPQVPYGRLEVHHIVPRSEGGRDELENLATLCDLCHATVHPHMGPAWVGLLDLPKEEQNKNWPLLEMARKEFTDFLKLPLEKSVGLPAIVWAERPWPSAGQGLEELEGVRG